MKDFLTDDSGDLLISDGDFAVGDSDLQHQRNLLLAAKGSYKQYPTTGVGMLDFLNDDNPGEFLREVRLQLSQDGMVVQKLAMAEGQLQIEATYGS